MSKRTCKTCKKEKKITEFAKRTKTVYRYNCKECQNEYARRKYKDSDYLEKIKKKHERRKVEIVKKQLDFLRGKSCTDCKTDNILVLEFDHIEEKNNDIAQMIQYRRKWSEILKEIKKCEVVCANCHRMRTMKRANWLKYELVKNTEKNIV